MAVNPKGAGAGTKATASGDDHDSRALAALREIFEAGRPLSYVRSSEEHRIATILREAAGKLFPARIPVWTWSLTGGMRSDAGREAGKEARTPRGALDFIAAHDGAAIFHLKDFHEPMKESPEIRRRLRDLYEECFDTGKFVVISSPVRYIPEELSRNLAYVQLSVPDVNELLQFLEDDAERIAAAGGSVDTSPETLMRMAMALLGLTLDEARHAVRRALAKNHRLDADSLPQLLDEKRMLVNRVGLIEFIPTDLGLEDIGGLEYLKNWVVERRKLFAQRDSIGADIVPKGLLVMGISGCGKSLSAKAIASCFGLPLYRIDMTEIYSGRHGPAEGAFVEACRMLEQIAPAVCWFDEIEMGITSQETSGEQGRMFAFFLTWMQEKTRGLFVTATANRIDLLPAEMIRKGRFDEVFFVDLPLDDERVEIFRVHLRRRGADPEKFNLERLIRFTKGWTGAEIEQCVVAAFTAARLQDREINDEDLLNATASVVPLSKTMKEQVDHIRSWAYDRAVRASPREFAR
jgi:ATP-dependent 26S proteasome regulatory subunit